MEIRTETVDGLRCVFLKGRLDIAGTQAVDLKFTALTATQRTPVIVDLSEVEFISSIGIRLLATNAKSLQSYGAKMVLLKPQRAVSDVLRTSGIDQLIPIANSVGDAAAMLRPAG
jgi:anti-sigma B factor antagonist